MKWLKTVFIVGLMLNIVSLSYADVLVCKDGVCELRKSKKFKLSSQVAVLEGDYGTGDDITITYVSETLKYIGEKGEIGLTVPYLVRNGGGVTAGENVVATGRAIPDRADGIGDIVLKGTYYWVDETEDMPLIDLTAKVKFPSASEERGLGTGKYDFGTGLSFMKRFGKVAWFLDTDIVLRERPDNSTIKRFRFDYSIGTGYQFTEKFDAYVFLEGSSKSSSGTDAPVEAVGALTYKLSDKLRLNSYALFGLSDSSPDVGVSAGVTYYF